MSWVDDKLEHLAATVALEAATTRDAVHAASADMLRGIRVAGSTPRPLPATGGTVYGGRRRLMGWTARETGGTNPVSIDLYDGLDGGAVDPGRLVASFTVPAGGSVAHNAGEGYSFGEGLWAVVSGTGLLRGAVGIGALD